MKVSGMGNLNDTADNNAEPYAIYYEEMNEFKTIWLSQ